MSKPESRSASEAVSIGTTTGSLSESPTGAVAIPSHIGEYALIGELGRGGMGVVFKAADPHLKREIALKVMLPQFAANPQAKARFVREARAQAKVEHDHVAAIHQVAEHDGLPYLVMPLLKGMTLHAALRANPRPPLTEVIRIAREVAEGLAAAHEQGLVHRDIKPANIWLEGKKLRVKVLDFGLARIADAGSDAESATGPVTREGAVVGTPAYMSPEQGRGLVVDGRTDLWSLGVMLYQMTTGEMPFTGATQLALLTSLVLDNPPPPIAKNPTVPAALSDLVLRLLSKDPAYRPPTAEVLVEELRAIEMGLANAVRVIPLDAPPPIILAPEGPDPFADLDATEMSDEEAPADDKPLAASQATRGFPIWLVAVVLLAVAGIVGIVISQMGKKPVDVVKPDEPPKQDNPGKKPDPQPQPAKEKEPDRLAAEYVLGIGGTVRVNNEERDIKAVGGLPTAPFQLTYLHLGHNQQVSDAGLAACKECKNLTHLALQDTQVTDAGLAHFRDCKNLTILWIRGLRVTDAGLAYFKDCKNLTQLSLESTQVTDAGMVHIRDCNNLTHLDMAGTKVTDAGLAYFKDCKALTHLDLRNTQVGGTGLGHFKDCTTLRYLSLQSTPVTDAGLVHLNKFTNLTTLHLHDTPVTDTGLKELLDKSKLIELALRKTKVTLAGVKQLAAALPECKIEWDGGTIEPKKSPDRLAAEYVLSIGGMVRINNEARDIKAVSELPATPFQLTYLHLVGNKQVTDAGLATCKDCKNLTHLFLHVTQVSDVGLAHFKDCNNLTVLDLAGTKVSDVGLAYFKDCKKLATLNLGGTQVSDTGLAYFKDCASLVNLSLYRTNVSDAGLANFKGCKQLVQLSIYDNPQLTDAALVHVKDWQNLKSLDIRHSQVSDAGLARLKDCQNLIGIDLSACKKVTDAGVAHLKDCKNLTWVSMQKTKITDLGLAHLKGCANLTLLDLWVTSVTDSGLAHLKELTKLTSLNLRETKVAAKGVEDLAKALPQCRIEWAGGTIEPRKSPDRLAAEYALPIGGTVRINNENRALKTVGELPKEPFRLVSLHLNNNQQVTDAGLAACKDCTNLTVLYLHHTQVSDAGLAHFKVCKNFTELRLYNTKVTDAGLAYFKECENLMVLQLHNTQVSDVGLKELVDKPKLVSLDLRGTKVTEAGVKQLAAALPQCKIFWDGGTIEPKK